MYAVLKVLHYVGGAEITVAVSTGITMMGQIKPPVKEVQLCDMTTLMAHPKILVCKTLNSYHMTSSTDAP